MSVVFDWCDQGQAQIQNNGRLHWCVTFRKLHYILNIMRTVCHKHSISYQCQMWNPFIVNTSAVLKTTHSNSFRENSFVEPCIKPSQENLVTYGKAYLIGLYYGYVNQTLLLLFREWFNSHSDIEMAYPYASHIVVVYYLHILFSLLNINSLLHIGTSNCNTWGTCHDTRTVKYLFIYLCKECSCNSYPPSGTPIVMNNASTNYNICYWVAFIPRWKTLCHLLWITYRGAGFLAVIGCVSNLD